MVFIYPM